jgi:hypothetical protein
MVTELVAVYEPLVTVTVYEPAGMALRSCVVVEPSLQEYVYVPVPPATVTSMAPVDVP